MICLAAAAAAAAATTACGGRDRTAQTPVAGPSEVAELHIPHVDPELCDPGGKEVVTYDLNHDGEPNIWELYQMIEQDGTDVRVLTCKQVDFDGDGRKDYVVIYRESGEVLAEEFDFTFDGNFDVRTHYDERTRQVFLAERDTDFDGDIDVWESYDGGGNLELVKRDRNGDGNPDMWEQYEHGELVAILYDDTADGRVDRRERRARPTPATTDDEKPAAPQNAPIQDEGDELEAVDQDGATGD